MGMYGCTTEICMLYIAQKAGILASTKTLFTFPTNISLLKGTQTGKKSIPYQSPKSVKKIIYGFDRLQ